MGDVGVNPVNEASSAGSTGLETGASVEDDHQIAAEGLSLPGLSDTQAFSGSGHQYDGDHAPGDPEHGQHGADTVCP